MANRKYFLAAITAFIVWGFFAVELRYLSDYSAGQILYFRILIAAVCLIVLALIRRQTLQDNLQKFNQLESQKKWKLTLITLIGGLFLTFNWLIFIYVINHVNIKTGSFSYFICPVLTAVFAFVIIKENLNKYQWISVGLCVISCVLVGFQSVTELSYSVVIASTYALYLISQRRNLEFDRLLTLTVQILFSLIVLTPFYSLLVNEAPESGSFYLHILFIALVFTIIPLFLNLFALKGLKSATIGILMYLNPLIGFALAFFYYDEKTNYFQLTGYGLIVVAVLLFNYQTIIKVSEKNT